MRRGTLIAGVPVWLVLAFLIVWLPGPAPAQESEGTIVGTVVDASTAEPIVDAGVEVVGEGTTVRTDQNGKFRMQVAPGTHQLRIFAPLYRSARLRNVSVDPREATTVAVSLESLGSGIEVLEVVAEAVSAAEATQLLKRMRSASVSDNIAAQTIKRAPDSSAADIVQRIPAVTISQDQKPIIRGLNERYVLPLLNGSRLPSTDPNKRVLPFDLFPAEFIDALSVIKTYTPDLPGDSAGGTISIDLKEFPEVFYYRLGAKLGFNTASTFQDFDSYQGSDWDRLGFGARYRSLPGIFPDDKILDPRVPETAARQQAFAGSLNNVWNIDGETAPPDFDIDFSIGDTLGPLGYDFGLTFSNEWRVREDEVGRAFFNPQDFELAEGSIDLADIDDFLYDRSRFKTRLAAILTGAYQLTPTQKVSVRSFLNRATEDEVLNGVGRRFGFSDQEVHQDRFKYTERQLGFGQVGGQHTFPSVQLDWRTALSQTTEDEPDTRHQMYVREKDQPGKDLVLLFQSPSMVRTWSDLEEYLTDSAFDLTLPFMTGLPWTEVWSGLQAKFKMGFAYSFRDRDFTFRRFDYSQGTNVSGLDLTASLEELLTPQNIGPRAQYPFQFAEQTKNADFFQANQEIAGGYGMFDLPLIEERLRLVAGVRTEYSYIDLEGADQQSNPVSTHINDLDPLPGVNLIYSPRDDMNLRYGFSETVSRPEFRELTPTEFPVPGGERTVVGNPFLTSASITSHDVRWEWFLSPLEVLSATFFYKDMENPIEQVALSQTSRAADSFRNAEQATVYGVELEARKNLGFAAPWLSRSSWLERVAPHFHQLNALVNVSFIESDADLGVPAGIDCSAEPRPLECTEIQTSSSRSLVGQAPYTVNATLEYESWRWGTLRILYQTVGRSILAAGINKLPDIYREPRDELDFVWLFEIKPFGTPLSGKLAVKNILNDVFEETQGDITTSRFATGTTFSIGLTYSY